MRRVAVTAHSILLVALILAGAAIADDTEGVSIDAQPLSSALREFSEQTGLQVGYAAELAEGKDTPGVADVDDPDVALDRLLASTGLKHRFINAQTVIIRAVDVKEADNGDRVARLGRQQVLMAQVADSATQATAGNGSDDEGATGIVVGEVKDARTGANLKGALITVDATGRTARADSLGRFRVVGVPAGRQSISVSFLGYAPESIETSIRPGQTNTVVFELQGGSDLEEIVVVGQRSARALALNQERTAENSSSVISADLLGNFVGTTISESLRRAPGVAFEQDFATGDGTNIIVRGLAPDLNIVKFNGIELPEGSGEGRSADLSFLLADSVESVTISQTLLPNQDSGGTGGLIEIETKSALDRPARFARLSIEGRNRDDDFLDDYVFSGQLSGIFGAAENLGVGASLQYRDREIRSVSGGSPSLLFGAYLPNDSAGEPTFRSASQVPPGNAFPFFDTPGADSVYPAGLTSNDSLTATETLSFGLNAEWDWAGHSSLRFDYQLLENDVNGVSAGQSIFSSAPYLVRPVAARDGEELRALDDRFGWTPRILHTASLNESNSTTEVYTLRGKTVSKQFTFNYMAGYTIGETETPNSRSARFTSSSAALGWNDDEFIDRAAVDPIEGIILSPFAPLTPGSELIPIPLYTAAGFAAINNPASFERVTAGINANNGSNERRVAEFSVRYDFDHEYLRYLDVGFDYEVSEARSFRFSQASVSAGENYSSLADLGVGFDAIFLGGLGRDLGIRSFSTDNALGLLNGLERYGETGLLSVGELEANDIGFGVRATEAEFAPYIQARLDIGKWEVIGGGRYSSIDIEADDFDSPRLTTDLGFDQEFADANAVFRTESTTQEKFLPRFVVNYRPDENTVVRAGYSTAIARPQLSQISNTRSFSLNLRGLDAGQAPRLSISTGNEDLQPAQTDSYDLSFEYYGRDASALKVALFYKEIENLTEQNLVEGTDLLEGVTLPDFESAATFPAGFDVRAAAETGELVVFRRTPVNNPNDARIWGVQVAGEMQFGFLPGVWSGFGVYANYTYTESEKDFPVQIRDAGEIVDLLIEDVRFNGDPQNSGTIALTYNDFGIDSALIYSAQDRRLSQFNSNGLGRYDEAFESLDFRFAYTFEQSGVRYQAVLEGSDLLRDAGDAAVLRSQGDDQVYFLDRSFQGGREFRLGLVVTAAF